MVLASSWWFCMLPGVVHAGADPRALKAAKSGMSIHPVAAQSRVILQQPPAIPPQQPVAPGAAPLNIPQQSPGILQQFPASQGIPPPTPEPRPAPPDDFTMIIANLKNTSEAWPHISNAKTKELVVHYFISEFKDRGIRIGREPSHYVGFIDDMAAQNAPMLSRPFDQVLQFVAIIEYDFNNGQDKDEMAQQLLGEEGYLRNKRRLNLQ